MPILTLNPVSCSVIYNTGSAVSWSSIRNAGSGTYIASSSGERIATVQADAGGFNWLARGILAFNTSILGNNIRIISTKVRIYGNNKADTLSITPVLHLASATPSNPASLAAGDFSQIGRVTFGNITYAGFSTAGWNEFASNDNIILNINNLGYSCFSLQLSNDINDAAPTLPGSVATSTFAINMIDGSNQPELVIEYELLSTGLQMML